MAGDQQSLMARVERFEDPADPHNGPRYHTGKSCIERGCSEPAGTWWSKLWCFKHNVERMRRISASFATLNAAEGGS